MENNQRWYNPKNRLPESDVGVLAIVSGKPQPNITLDRVYCIAEYIPDEGWIVSEYPECTTLKVEAWTPLPDFGENRRNKMQIENIIKALRRMAVNTGALNCLGCGFEHNCGIHGCRVLREAADKLNELQRENDALFRAAMDNRKESGLTDD